MNQGWYGSLALGLVSLLISPFAASVSLSSENALMCINAGGGEFVDSHATTFEADVLYSGGGTSFHGHEIAQTTDDTLFQSERWGMFDYSIPLSPDDYLVTLYFAEIYYQATKSSGGPGSRVFDVFLENQLVEGGFDILVNVPSKTAFSRTYATTVEDNDLNVSFARIADYPKLSGLCVHLNAGDPDGDGYQAENDAFPLDPNEWADSDNDGVGDNADAFPNDSTEWTDLDNDGVGDNSDPDRDGDGHLNDDDAFPDDPDEWLDSDGDGIGDNADPTPLPEVSAYEMCINAGGPAYTAVDGTEYQADGYYSSGRTSTHPHDIADTNDDLIYQSERWRDFNYSIPVPDAGTYTVELEFAEIYYQATSSSGGPGSRVFDVFVEDALVADNFDILAHVPSKTALTLNHMVLVEDGSVDIGFGAIQDWPKLSALCVRASLDDTDGDGVADNEDAFPFDADEWADTDGDGVGDNADLFPGDATEWADLDGDGVGDNADPDRDGDGVANAEDVYPNDPERWEDEPVQPGSDWGYCVNVGGEELVSTSGLTYQADQHFSGGSASGVTHEIAATKDDALYQTDRWGNFVYEIPVPQESDYVATLHFAEVYFQASNSRVFDIYLEDSLVEPSFDILTHVPSKTALSKDYVVPVSDGSLKVSFAATSDQPKLSAVCLHQTYGDADGDGVRDANDSFPMDAAEWQDSDGDGVGNNGDAFPSDPDEWSDLDGDGIGDNSDPDRDGDGYPNDDDANPDDPNVSAYQMCVNAGGGAYTASDGTEYQSDSYYSGGRTSTHVHDIADTDDDSLYHTERRASFAYYLPVPEAGDYIATLHFAEVYFQASTSDGGPGSRVFDIYLEDAPVEQGFDILARVPSKTALSRNYLVPVSDDSLKLSFVADSDQPKLSAVCLRQSNGDADGDGVTDANDPFPLDAAEWQDSDGDGVGDNADAFPSDAGEWSDLDGDGIGNNADPDRDGDGYLNEQDAFPNDPGEWLDSDGDGLGDNTDPKPYEPIDPFEMCINAGGNAYTTAGGVDYLADQHYSGGRSSSYDIDIADTEDDKLYQSERWGSFSYSIPVPSNSRPYNVALMFAEIYFQTVNSSGWAGSRVFDIYIEGQEVRSGFDMIAEAGSQTAIVQRYLAEVDDGSVDISFGSVIDAPKLSALCVFDSNGDFDGDGFADNNDAFPNDPGEWLDSDGDGIGDNADVFPSDSSEWADTDGDGIGNNSDPDMDGDGHLNENDAFPLDPTEWSDLDGDGIGDNTDTDRDGDGYANDVDMFPDDPDNWEDTNNNGIGDNSDPDLDSDGDGYSNADDAFPRDATEWVDTDGDGYGDNSDAYPADASRWLLSDPFEVLFVKGTEAIDTMAKAQALIDNPDQYTTVSMSSDIISFSDGSSGNTGIFANSEAFPFDDHFAMRATRLVSIPEDGEYTFLTRSDDGVRLTIDGQVIIDDGEPHSVTSTDVTVYLEAGMKQVELIYFESSKAAVIELAAARGTQNDFYFSGVDEMSAITDRVDAILTPPTEFARHIGGQWSEVVQWAEIPVSAAQLPDGKLLTWVGGTEITDTGKKSTASIYDPETGSFVEKDHSSHNQFCSGIAQMEDGSIFNSGGNPFTEDTSRFDIETMSWVTLDDMSYPRWYPTTLTMPDNRVFTAFAKGAGNTSEIYSDVLQQWLDTPGATMQSLVDEQNLINSNQSGNGSTDMQWYAFMHVAPNGRVFQSGPMQTMHWFDTAGQGDVEQIGTRLGGDQARMFGSAVMYDIGKILITGGNDASEEKPSSNKAITVDLNGAAPVIQETTPMRHKRTFQDSVVLPDGRVMVIGGTTEAKLFDDGGSVLQPEIWDPETGQWTAVNSLTIPRNYHSTALLMKDGRVFTGGGGACGACDANHQDAQFYSPDYLFKSDGTPASRPEILQAPLQARAGTLMTVNTTDTIAGFNMIRLQGTTHSINTDQRFVPLEFDGGNGEYSVEVNPNPNVMIPGYYWLFAVNEDGVPSEGFAIQVVRQSDDLDSDGDGIIDSQDAFPDDPTEWTDTDGDGTGDNADVYPNDPNEWADMDGDGIGDNSDPDRDGDGYPNEEDAFPGDPTEWIDTDGDGVGDNADLYPQDPNQWGDGTTQWAVRDPEFGTPDARHESDYIAVNERLYLIGGRNSRAVNVYSALTNSWADHGVPRDGSFQELQLHHYQSVEVGGRIYIVGAFKGGFPGETPVAEIYSFDPDAPTQWREESVIPEDRRRGSAAAANYGGKIYVVGGNTKGHNAGWVSWFDVYDPVEKTWTTLPDAPHARDHHRASVVDGKLYVVAGRRSSVNLGNAIGDTEASVDVYDFATGQWSTLDNTLPTPRAGVAMIKHGPELVVAAGESPAGDHTEVEALDVRTGSWRELPSLITGRNAPGGASYGNELFIAAGRNGNTELSSQEVMSLIPRVAPEDSDNDGVVDDEDAFPQNSGEYLDSDGDGVGDNTDEFPGDPADWVDSDGDGVGDNTDPFPNNDSEWADTDSDGVGDNADFYPDDPTLYAQPPMPVLNSTTLAVEQEADTDRVWVVNPDNDTVSLVVGDQRIAEVAVGGKPSSIALAADGSRVWVTNKADASVSAIDTTSQVVVDTIDLPSNSQPHGLVRVPGTDDLLIVLEARMELVRLDTGTSQVSATVTLSGSPRHLAVSSDGNVVYVTNFITPPLPGEDGLTPDVANGGGELWVMDAQSLSLMETISLGYRNRGVSESTGPGMPNYLNAPVLSPDGNWAYVPSKQDNILAGAARGGPGMTFDQTVRAVTSRVDLVAGSENPGARIDHDNASVATGAVVTADGRYLFVALETSREVAVYNLEQGYQLTRLATGLAPQGLALSADGERLLIHNFMDRSLQSYDLAAILVDNLPQASSVHTVDLVGNETMASDVLLGKQLFYDAADDRLARDNYMSCASCHNDGGHDGRVWDLTSLGEGVRNTIDLTGKGAGHGRIHWTGNFDEVQDFESQIRVLAGGTGLIDDSEFNLADDPLSSSRAGLSADLDALASYLASLDSHPPSPFHDGSLSTAASAGEVVYQRENCASCHSGEQLTDSGTGVVHDIGTITDATGSNNHGSVFGIDTPTLDLLWATAPYLHNGGALSIAEAILAHDNITVTEQEVVELEFYLLESDAGRP